MNTNIVLCKFIIFNETCNHYCQRNKISVETVGFYIQTGSEDGEIDRDDYCVWNARDIIEIEKGQKLRLL